MNCPFLFGQVCMHGLESTLSLESLIMWIVVSILTKELSLRDRLIFTLKTFISSFPCFTYLWHSSVSLSLLQWDLLLFYPSYREGCSSRGAGTRRWPAGGAGEDTDHRCSGHGWRLHTDSIRSAQNCKLCFSTTGYYKQQFHFFVQYFWGFVTHLFSLQPHHSFPG